MNKINLIINKIHELDKFKRKLEKDIELTNKTKSKLINNECKRILKEFNKNYKNHWIRTNDNNQTEFMIIKKVISVNESYGSFHVDVIIEKGSLIIISNDKEVFEYHSTDTNELIFAETTEIIEPEEVNKLVNKHIKSVATKFNKLFDKKK